MNRTRWEVNKQLPMTVHIYLLIATDDPMNVVDCQSSFSIVVVSQERQSKPPVCKIVAIKILLAVADHASAYMTFISKSDKVQKLQLHFHIMQFNILSIFRSYINNRPFPHT